MNIMHKRQKGFALILVLLIGALMMVPVLMLLSSVAPRRTSVSGEAVSDRMLSLADATVDKILAQINTFPSLVSTDTTLQLGFSNIASWYSDHPVSGETPAYKTVNTVVSKYAITYLLATLNGGTAYQPSSTADPQTRLQAYTDSNTYPSGGVTDGSGSLWDIEDNVSTYLYDLTNQEFYAVWSGSGSGTKIASVSHVGIADDILAPSPIRNLSTGEIRTGGLAAWDSTYATDNRWIEVDTNTQYEDDGTPGQQSTKFEIRVSAYPVTSSGTQYVARNILAEATLKPLNVKTTGGASGPYDKALWSGSKLTLNGNTTVAAADNLADALLGTYLTGAGVNKGNIYANGEIDAKAGSITIGGILYTSLPQSSDPKKGPISLNQTPSVGGTAYGKQESLPDFPTGTESSVKKTAQDGESNDKYFSSSYTASGATLAVNGGSWYIDGNLTLDGTTINLGSDPLKPGVIWVNGDITFKSGTTIQGQGKIVANGSITFQGNNSSLKYADSTSMVAVVALGADSKGVSIDMQGKQDFMGFFYAPNGNIVKGGTGTVFGSLIAGGSVSFEAGALTLNGGNVIVYDGRWSDSVIMPAGALTVESVRFTGSAIYRFSWREVISKPVTQSNIQALNPQFVFIR